MQRKMAFGCVVQSVAILDIGGSTSTPAVAADRTPCQMPFFYLRVEGYQESENIKRAHNNLSPATIDPYRPSNNLSAATEPYRTYDNLCQTIISPYRACNDLSATTDP